MSLQAQFCMIYMQYVTTLAQWTWATTQPAVQMKVVGASTMIPGEICPAHIILCYYAMPCILHRLFKNPTVSVGRLYYKGTVSYTYSPPTVWLQSQRTSFRPIKPMCCSTSAATAPPPSGNRPETGWAEQPIRATLPPVSIETNWSSSAVTLASMNAANSMSMPSNKLWGEGGERSSLKGGLEEAISPPESWTCFWRVSVRELRPLRQAAVSVPYFSGRSEWCACAWCRALNIG